MELKKFNADLKELIIKLIQKKKLLMAINKIKKYLYTANIIGMHTECTDIPQLAKAINDAYDFPIVTSNNAECTMSRAA